MSSKLTTAKEEERQMNNFFNTLVAKLIATIVIIGGAVFTAVTVFCAPGISTKAAVCICVFCVLSGSMLTVGIWGDEKREKP